MSAKNTDDFDWIERDKEEMNMAKRINEWGDLPEKEPAPLWFGLLILFLIWIFGVIVGAYMIGWRI